MVEHKILGTADGRIDADSKTDSTVFPVHSVEA